MKLSGLESATRTMIDDTVEPYLWPTVDIDRRLNNAVREACIRARLLRVDAEADPDRCLLSVPTAAQGRVSLDPDIIAIRSASLSDACHPLRLMSSDDMDRWEPGWDAEGAAQRCRPQYLVMDLAQKVVRLWPAPDVDLILRLRAWRVPVLSEQMRQPDDSPAIVLPDAEELCHWAAYECYLVKDAETHDPGKASEHLALFESRFGSRPTLHDMARWADTPPRARRAHMF